MVEGGPRSSEPTNREWLDALLGWWSRPTPGVQSEDQDPLDAPYLQQVEAERSGAGGIQPLGRVAIRQPQELLTLTQFGPREGSVQQPLGEVTDVRSQLKRLLYHAVRRPHGVGGALWWIV